MVDMTLACFLGRTFMGPAGEGIVPWKRIADGAGGGRLEGKDQGNVKKKGPCEKSVEVGSGRSPKSCLCQLQGEKPFHPRPKRLCREASISS